MSWVFLKPKQPRWLHVSVAIALGTLAVFVALARWWPWAPGRLWGLVFGTLAATVFLIDGLYPLRRRLMGWPFGTAQRWLQFHIYGGALASLLVLIHVGFELPHGQFGWWLFGLTFWTVATGLVGVWLQKWIPYLMTSQLSVEALYDRIPEMSARLRTEADLLMKGSTDVLQRFYLGEVRPALAGATASWAFLADIRGGRERQLAPFRNVEQFLANEERERLKDLEYLVSEKLELDAQYSLQRVLQLWLPVHLFPAMALLGLLAVHIVAVLYF
jgi:hypothetical protein